MEREITELLESGLFSVYTAASSAIFYKGNLVYHVRVGKPNPDREPERNIGDDSLYDIASLTKIFVTTALLSLFYKKGFSIDIPVSSIIPEFTGKRPVSSTDKLFDIGKITFRHLLTHSAGLPSWKPFYKKMKGEEIKRAVLSTELSYIPGEMIVYSDLGYMIIGWALERITGKSLRDVVRETVIDPIGLQNTDYGPIDRERCIATEFCPWRKRRLCGEVHDENAFALGGVAGHAGIFSTAFDVAKLGLMWLEGISGISHFGLPRRVFVDAVMPQKEFQNQRRGLGWALWTQGSPARFFGKNTFGHLGFTGTSLFVDPDRELVVSLLTNRVYYGRNPASILLFRIKFHRKVAELYP